MRPGNRTNGPCAAYDRAMRVLYVCTGNICRSPTAELLTTAFAREAGRGELSAHSAGTRGMVGRPMEPTAALVLRQLGGEPDGFVARRLSPHIAQDADLVITMAESHRAAVLQAAPRMLKRTFTLREAARLQQLSGAETVTELAAARAQFPAPGPEDVTDPIGRDEDTFVAVGTEIADLLLPLLARIHD
ncbi:protein-tyrosine-phosphatase [Rhodococcus ruber BKS 20-38]|uniref:Protein-tyrosine-phosphatase n=2 Tax=Rhodococcus ruber TaxID=1830 RepID=M2XVU0_9NOCA|nr:protein-tyrosine-phosphatase [Rhodococcus ruber BKS 20-38]